MKEAEGSDDDEVLRGPWWSRHCHTNMLVVWNFPANRTNMLSCFIAILSMRKLVRDGPKWKNGKLSKERREY